MNGALPWRNLRRADMILRADARMRIGPTRRSVLALIGSLAPAAAFAAYPQRPIKLVVALAPGGPADTAARLFAPYFSERLGQSVVIENRTGASSVVGTESVVRAPPDGYTLLFGSSSSFAVNPAVMKNLRFDVRTDLRLVGLVSYTPHVLVVRAALAASSAGADLRRAWILRDGIFVLVWPGGAGEYARRRHRRLGRRDAFRLCVGELSGWAAKARSRTIQLEPRTVRRLHQGGVRQ